MHSILHALLQRVGLASSEVKDYRRFLFDELQARLEGRKPDRILEIGPKDGKDTRRLLSLEPGQLTLVDLPRLYEHNQKWLAELDASKIDYLSANLMYSEEAAKLDPFDIVWCTGVLYHNPEQLRMIRKLHDLLVPGGWLVLESATARVYPGLRNVNCVEVIWPPSEELKRKYSISMNITHLPSAKAMESWLQMVGFEDVARSGCHRYVSRALHKGRAAYLARKPDTPRDGAYYSLGESEEGYLIGKSL